MSTDERLSELLHTHTPGPPPDIDLDLMAARARDQRPAPRPRRMLLPVIAAAAVIAVVLAGYTIRRMSDSTPAGPPSIAGPALRDGRGAPTEAQLDWATKQVNAFIGIAPSPQPLDFPPVLVAVQEVEVSPDGRTLTATFAGSVQPASRPCGEDYYGYAVQTDAVIALLVTSVRYSDGSTPYGCARPAMERTATVRLDEPLDGRPVIEAAHGERVPVTQR